MFTARYLLILRCFRLDELRHRLIPVYTYDPSEEPEWEEDVDEEQELAVSKPPKF